MKKYILIILTAFLFSMCNTSKPATAAKPEVQYKDDFRSATDKEKSDFLKKIKATGNEYSALIFTQNFKGEEVIVSNSKKTLYKGYLISNGRTLIAGTMRIENAVDTKVYDSTNKKEVIIDAKEAQKHKFIYVMKSPGSENSFTLTYSNTLRPLK